MFLGNSYGETDQSQYCLQLPHISVRECEKKQTKVLVFTVYFRLSNMEARGLGPGWSNILSGKDL